MTDHEKLMTAVMSPDVKNAATTFVEELVSSTMLAVQQDPRAYGFVSLKDHDARVAELLEANNREVERRREAEARDCLELYPLESYHEDYGPVLWWKLPVVEPPYCGSPLDLGRTIEVELGHGSKEIIEFGGWPGYHTHWSQIPNVWLHPVILDRPKGACL